MKTSDEGLNLIKKYEGLRLVAYKCPAGVWTIGYGHTRGVSQGMEITQAQADQYLRADIVSSERAVDQYNPIYNFSQGQYDALVSFTFNCGAGNLKKLLNGGLRTKLEISDAITRYTKAGGKTLNGLVRRRNEEKQLFDRGLL